ncbi:hypothetical protein B0H11DRAFT_2306441 [Mycena galericulata]|nr:hypothetical protein B0H11DRAFT_2306441 [Mycena galericulata]
MTEIERRAHNALRDIPDPLDDDDMGGGGTYEDDVLHGRAAADISHAGEALTEEDVDLANESLLEQLREHHKQGLVPVAPYHPTVVITTRALEVFRVVHLRCPRLGIQPFVRALCDIHGVAPRPWLSSQFSVAFDVYLAIRAVVDRRVEVELGRDAPDWRLKNACPPCLYKLEGEAPLEIAMMMTIDGNNSLSRFALREREVVGEDGSTAPGASKERKDSREVPGDYYLSREEVDKWAREGMEDLMKGAVPDEEHGEDEDGCTERWQNMKEDVTTRAWGMYDETGFFPALCRHGFVLVVADMVKSGELAKYGFAITNHLLRVLGELGLGYDIGCKFGKMVKTHPVLGPLAIDQRFRALVGAFHGHAHNRRCQLCNLSTYVKGVGQEGLETCESFFSKSNALAATTRYATAFHRKQAITTYLKHTDRFDTWQGLSLLLCNKYRRALRTKETHAELHDAMLRLGVQSREEFEAWLEEEKVHLRTLSKEPLQETLEMEYYQKLVNLQDIDRGAVHAYARRGRTQRRHALELREKAIAAVQDLELRLEVETRWVAGCEKWEAAAGLVSRCRYQRALDHLEGLIIARMFELGKCNLSGTGYKLRTHIAKALQARSKAIKTAISKYNEAAEAMVPQKPTLDWEQVVEYAFLSDFDLLREGREDIWEKPWARPAGHMAMDQHFKLLRADEEIVRLDIEIPRFVTYIADEEAFLVREEVRLVEEGQLEMAHQVCLLRLERSRFTALHMSRLNKLSKEPGCTASMLPGTSMRPVTPPPNIPFPPTPPQTPSPEDTDDEEEEEGEDDMVASIIGDFTRIVHITDDRGRRGADFEA